MAAELSDEALMARYRDGDAAAFETLYARHRGGLYRYFLRQCGEPARAEELYQEVWLSVIHARARYQPSAKFTTYLYRIAHNRLVDEYRSRAGLPVSFEQADCAEAEAIADAAAADPAEQVAAQEQAGRLLAALAALPEAQREAFLLHQEGGLTLEEIAQATGVEFETAKSRLRYAVARLRQALHD